jgi:hypothetical protein
MQPSEAGSAPLRMPLESEGSCRHDNATIAVLFSVVLLSCCYFFTGGGWNQASRMDLVRAIVDQHTLTIDAYADNTGDKALWRGHYYSDKAPGTALLAVPFAAAAEAIARRFTTDDDTILMAEARASLLVCSAIPTALASVAIYLIALLLGCKSGTAAIAAWSYGIGTPAWAYGTFFWGHALAAACLIMGFGVGLAISRRAWSKRSAWMSVAVGWLLGWAAITEYTAAIPAAMITVLAFGRGWQRDRRRAPQLVAHVVLGALGPLAILGVYNHLAFGSVFSIGYDSVVGFAGMKAGLFGITWPRFEILKQLLIGQERGLLWLSPVLVLAPVGFFAFVRAPSHRTLGMTAAGIFVYYLLLNASYEYWDGGHCYGPRHLAAGLPFLCLGLAAPWSDKSRATLVLKALAVASVVLTLMGMATHPMTPPVSRPLAEIFWPSILDARLSQNMDPLFNLSATHSQNLGELLGLRGLISLVPLLLLWKLAAVILNRIQGWHGEDRSLLHHQPSHRQGSPAGS